jgi:hypothetical protein
MLASAGVGPSVAQQPQPASTSETVRRFKHLHWSAADAHFQSEGSAEIAAQQANKPEISVTGNNVDYDSRLGIVQVKNGISIRRGTDILTGESGEYNVHTGAGHIVSAKVLSENFTMHGSSIEAMENGSYVMHDGEFTTCIRGRPDYHIHARKVVVSPDRYVTIDGAQLYVGKTALPTLPTFKRSLNHSAPVSTPVPAYSVSEGPVIRIHESPISRPLEALDYDIRLNLRTYPGGVLAYQRDLGSAVPNLAPPRGILQSIDDPLRGILDRISPPVYARYDYSAAPSVQPKRIFAYSMLINDEYIFNRFRNDIQLDALPIVGVHFSNLLDSRHAEAKRVEQSEAADPALTLSALKVPRDVPPTLDIDLSAGYFQEFPTNVDQARLSLKVDLASRPMSINKHLSWRIGATNWLNTYSGGSTYDLLSPDIEADYVPTSTSLIGIGYRYLSDSGSTPFVFDRRDLRQELRLRYRVGGPWSFGMIGRYDLERVKAYDAELSIVRNLDCMQIGLSYRVLSQSVNVIFNFLPSAASRARHRAIAESSSN